MNSWLSESDEPLEEFEYPDEPTEDDEPSETRSCPECQAEIYEDAEQCPHCGNYIHHSTSPWSDRPTWWIAAGLLGVIALVIALTAFF